MASQQPDARTALAVRRDAEGKQVTAPSNLQQKLNSGAMQAAFQMAMPRGREAIQLVRDALTCLRTIQNLDSCDDESVLGALMTCAQLGLRPGVLGEAWPLPFWDHRTNDGKGGYRAQLVIGYQGLISLAHRSGQIRSLIARTVHARDTFDVDYGLADTLVHKPQLFSDPGEPIAYYAIAKFASGGHAFLVMTQAEMLRHRDLYAPRNKRKEIVGPWISNFEGQALKTTIRRLAKYMPRSTEMQEALHADGGLRVDATPELAATQTTGYPPALAAVSHWEGDAVETPDAEADAVEPAETDRLIEPPPVANEQLHMITDAQLRALHAAANKIGDLKDREALLVWIAGIIGREIQSTKELYLAEASTVIDAMIERRRAETQAVKGDKLTPAERQQHSAVLRDATGRESEQPTDDDRIPF